MAFSLRLTGYGKDGSKLLDLEPFWWEIRDLNKEVKLNWVTSNDTGSYRDDDADVSVEDARRLHQYFKPSAIRHIEWYTNHIREFFPNNADRLRHLDDFKSELEAIENAVGVDAAKYSHFHLCVYEWDTGM